ncbi:MAG TPA: hypothetical protein PKA90_14390 [Ignavibacteria bacterium]|nr:hypothetical protein [Ignavibacteria bacterium]HMR41608.1 hypothetical protein [Ignavibacteria bacterium]
MNTYIIIGIGFGLLLFLIFKRSIFRKEGNAGFKTHMDPKALMNNEKMKMAVNEFIKRGKKIEAIKYIHKSGDVTLSEAKDFVEKIELMGRSGISSHEGNADNIYSNSDSADDSLLNSKVKALVISGHKINAIKLVAEEKKIRLAEAKDYVEKVELGITDGKI